MATSDEIYNHLLTIRAELGELRAEVRALKQRAAWTSGIASAVIASTVSWLITHYM